MHSCNIRKRHYADADADAWYGQVWREWTRRGRYLPQGTSTLCYLLLIRIEGDQP